MSRTDTAHDHWDGRWATEAGRAGWTEPDPWVRETCAALPPGRALDLGCGVGRHALMLARMGHGVTALDAAPEGVARTERLAAAEGLPLRGVVAPMTALPLKDASQDLVLSFNVIYHGDRAVVVAALREIARVLRPGGLLVGTLLSLRNANVGVGRELSPGTWVRDPDGPGSDDKAHPHHYCDARGALALLAGFEPLTLRDRVQGKPGSWHWDVVAERA